MVIEDDSFVQLLTLTFNTKKQIVAWKSKMLNKLNFTGNAMMNNAITTLLFIGVGLQYHSVLKKSFPYEYRCEILLSEHIFLSLSWFSLPWGCEQEPICFQLVARMLTYLDRAVKIDLFCGYEVAVAKFYCIVIIGKEIAQTQCREIKYL